MRETQNVGKKSIQVQISNTVGRNMILSTEFRVMLVKMVKDKKKEEQDKGNLTKIVTEDKH